MKIMQLMNLMILLKQICRMFYILLMFKYSILFHLKCYDSSYASSLMTMLMTMLVTILRIIVDRSSLEHRLVSKSTLFRVSLCFSESYR